MKKRRLILGDYDTAEDGLFTLSACKITKGSQVQSFVSVPGRYAPIDTSTLLTDGQPYYGNAALDATLESSEGTRDERLARVSGMVNALDGRSMRIIHPDHPERYLVGRVQVRPEYNDPAHCAVRVSAVCEPWLYNAQETEVQANLPHAEIHKIGGKTRKTKNLFDPAPIGTKTFIGLTYTTEGSYVKINGTKANGANIHIMTAPNMTLPAGTYTVSVRMISGTVTGIEASGGVFFGINQNTYGQRTTPGVSKVGDVGVRTFTLSEPTLVSSFDIAPDYASVGAVFNNAVFACQFEQANTATEYEPYFEGLRSAPVTEVESVGVNLFKAEFGGDGYFLSGWGDELEAVDANTISYIPKNGQGADYIRFAQKYTSGVYTLSNKSKVPRQMFWLYDALGNNISAQYQFSFGATYNQYYDGFYSDVEKLSITVPDGVSFWRYGVFFQIDNNNKVTISEIQVAKGENTPYRPYTRNTLPIPEAVQALDGYGDGVSESVYNYIDFETKQFVKRVERVVFDGTEYVGKNSTDAGDSLYYFRPSKAPVSAQCVSTLPVDGTPVGSTIGVAVSVQYNVVYFNFGESVANQYGNTAQGMKQYLAEKYAAGNPFIVDYEITPEITDISDLLSGVNTIPAEEGGTLTMVNPYGYEVPHEVTYYLDGENPQQVELTNAGRLAVVPVVTVKGEVTLSYGNITQTLSTGTYTLPWLYLTPDKGPLLPASHIVTCSGGGSVTFTYREAVLAE